MTYTHQIERLPAMLLMLLSVTVYWVYGFGFDAGFQFDDQPNIGGVSGVNDWLSAMVYLFDGKAGPLGRPLSFATFLMQKDSWPDDPAAFFRVNTLIHLLNTVLVYGFSVKLLQLVLKDRRQASWVALMSAALWSSTPLLVSASLMAVQRMTTLSTTFMLFGLFGYVHGRSMLKSVPSRAYWWMSLSVVAGTALALLCKENGALLPAYLLVLELTIVRKFDRGDYPGSRNWAALFLVLPVILLVAAFIYKWPTLSAAYGTRNFTLIERLMTESRILWDYFGQIFLPTRSGSGPYHDDYTVSRNLFSPLTTLAAILAWGAVLVSAWRVRGTLPWLWFGLLWFMVGHTMESSFLGLELYFEHRNYLPALGPLLAGTVMAWQVPRKVYHLVISGIVVMILLRLFVLLETTSTWGQSMLAAKLWVQEHPLSPRAAQHLTRVYFYAGNEEATKLATLEGHARIKTDAALALQTVYLSCKERDEPTFQARLKSIYPVMAGGSGINAIPELLGKILEAKQLGACQHFSFDQMFEVTDMLLQNPHITSASGILASVHLIRYRLYALQGKPNYSIRELMTAFSIRKEMTIATVTARAMANAGHPHEALVFLDKSLAYMPGNPMLRQVWKTEIDKMRAAIQLSMDEANAK